jgi:serine/threonine protein kinase
MGEHSKRDLTRVGTPFYMSPQILKGNSYGYRTDIYSIGVLLYELLFGELPYCDSKSLTELCQRAHKGIQ